MLLALVTVAVGAAVAGAPMAVNATSGAKGEMGDAGAVIEMDATDPVAARAGVAAAEQRFGPVEVIAHTSVAVPGLAQALDVRAQDLHGVYSQPMLALRKGLYPVQADEVALTPRAATLLSTSVGHRVVLGGVDRTVVGQVENPSDLSDDFALVAPGAVTAADWLSVLLKSDRRIGGADPAATDGPAGPSFRIRVMGDEKSAVVAAVLVATTLAMSLVCLVAAAGFVVVAQRRQRQLGLLAAVGATERHLRLVMLANGAIVGATAALLGGALGVLGWMAAAPGVEAAAGRRISRFDLPWGLIAECLIIAVVVATAAAWWPARTMAKLPVMAALSGRPVRPSPVPRYVALALGLLALGVGATAAARPTGDVRPLVLIAGVVAVVVGVVLAPPAAIRALSAPARRLPFAARLALRDLVRHQARAASALAAITLVIGISVAIVVVAKAGDYRRDEGNLSAQQLLIRIGDRDAGPDPNLSPADRARLDAAAARVNAALGGPTVYPLDVAMNPAGPKGTNRAEPVTVATPIDHGFRGVGAAYLATPDLLTQRAPHPV